MLQVLNELDNENKKLQVKSEKQSDFKYNLMIENRQECSLNGHFFV